MICFICAVKSYNRHISKNHRKAIAKWIEEEGDKACIMWLDRNHQKEKVAKKINDYQTLLDWKKSKMRHY